MSYQEGTQQFVNPYHFLSLAKALEKKFQYRQKKQEGNLTGRIECELETRTPIFIPNTTSVEERNGENISDVFGKRTTPKNAKEKAEIVKSYDFYSYENLQGKKRPPEPVPVIPGSEIRGMIRSAFEAVTNSCLSTIDDEQKLYKRTTNVGQAGRLICEERQWKIQPCKRIGIKTKDIYGKQWANNQMIYDPMTIPNLSTTISAYHEGEEVAVIASVEYYPKVKRGWNNQPDHITRLFREVISINRGHNVAYEYVYAEAQQNFNGYYHKGEPFGDKKHHESIFVPTGRTFDVDESTVQNLLENFKLYRDQTVNTHLKQRKGATAKEHSGYHHVGRIDRIEDLHGKLVYYAERNNRYYLCPAAIGREVFHNRLTGILPPNARPCQDIRQLCEACALFGVVGTDSHIEQKNRAAASRVRFTDATTSSGKYAFDSPKTLQELASPKLSATEFYLKKTAAKADLWNYDYAGNWRRRPNGTVTNSWDDINKPYTPEIRGRKFYWHQPNPSPYLENEKDATDRHVHVRPLKSGTFTFKVYFNNISEEELKKLLWALEIGGSPKHAHKIGMGKPLGLGSVKITVTGITKREILVEKDAITYRTVPLSKPDYAKVEEALVEKAVLDEFLEITNFTKFQNAPNKVHYPKNEDSTESYKWFMANKQIGNPATSPIIHQPLPAITSPDLKEYREQ